MGQEFLSDILGEHADDMVIDPCCWILQTDVLCPGKVVGMQHVHDRGHLYGPVVVVQRNAVIDTTPVSTI